MLMPMPPPPGPRSRARSPPRPFRFRCARHAEVACCCRPVRSGTGVRGCCLVDRRRAAPGPFAGFSMSLVKKAAGGDAGGEDADRPSLVDLRLQAGSGEPAGFAGLAGPMGAPAAQRAPPMPPSPRGSGPSQNSSPTRSSRSRPTWRLRRAAACRWASARPHRTDTRSTRSLPTLAMAAFGGICSAAGGYGRADLNT
jgi:hypothetical protein